MKRSVTGRHVEVTPAIRHIIDQKLVNDNAISVQVVLSRGHHQYCAEVVLHVRGDHMLHGENEGDQWSQAIGGAVDKINQQAHTLKGKWSTRHRADAR